MNDLEHAHTGTRALGLSAAAVSLRRCESGQPTPATAELVVIDLVAEHDEQPHEQCPGDGDFGLPMATAGFDALIKPADVPITAALRVKQSAIGRFHKGPLQIHIDIVANRSKAHLARTGIFPYDEPRPKDQLISFHYHQCSEPN